MLAVGRLDRRSDVYSLGATLWELLTLRPLFGAGEQTPTPDLMLEIQQDRPRAPREFNPGGPRTWKRSCSGAWRRQPPALRTAGELAADLARWLRGEPVQAQGGRAG